ncbi:DUF92 domain-containing protein [Salipaludibacillus sp. LMS25]|uniref:DUF92 domain-containing protein n=1 Tax=Salipaludibacillus sp. LMS25 TaxID=2924031 RepID=UPI0020D180C4|nr:DUF92 domain-containing protein [Salipaludibacillus sp. LMS25]UTR14430.1 DUF92 domain-containing protein [Salipaludibacillus sp. LMS25]
MTFLLLIGVVILATIAWKTEALTKKGAMTSVVIGAFISMGASLPGLLLLGAFFISSSVIGRVVKSVNTGNDIEDKGETRDEKQVLANGGMAAFASLAFLFTGENLWLMGLIGSLAAANSDTWASSIGKMSSNPPTLVLSRYQVLPGQSGGTTLLGHLAALLGSTFIIFIAVIVNPLGFLGEVPLLSWLILIMAGYAGQYSDAIAGRFLQSLYKCPHCGALTEKSMHCLIKGDLIKGFPRITNDTVNAVCTLTGLVFGMLTGYYFNI